ncbi:hypothetical protein SAMN05443529_11234 [Desulfosporosinus hippei DSM 8344]|uniref:Uncharacterized protein n=1 Tax=Desulfosporosinus hippei DSM 8344 TaxID=1121419 RepID=A0A1G8BGZ1_9FIRM|nr:hypothetical protein SAMN05443529_11234 [Desulfosporosinus hippei DSM 8344]
MSSKFDQEQQKCIFRGAARLLRFAKVPLTYYLKRREAYEREILCNS